METFLTIFFFALGAIVASFVTVVAERVYTGHSWSRGRSRCDACNVMLSSRDLVPVLSWVLHQGRCRHCGAKVAPHSTLAEVILGATFASLYGVFGLTPPLVLFLVFVSLLLFAVLYDLRHTLIPNEVSILLVCVGVLYAFIFSPTTQQLGASLLIAGVISLGFFLLHFLSRGRAMGLADAPIAFALSLMTHPYAFGGLLWSFWIGAGVGILLLVMKRKGLTMKSEVPFVPFMALGFLLAFFLQWNPLL